MRYLFLLLILMVSCGSEQDYNEEIQFKKILKCLTIEGGSCETGTDELVGITDNDVEETL